MSNTVKIIVLIILFVIVVILGVAAALWPSVILTGLTAFAALLFLIMLVLVFVTRNSGPVRVDEGAITIAIKDRDGKLARFEKTQIITPLGADLVDIRDRNAFTRGTIDDFELEPGHVGERMTVGKYYIIKTVFKPPLPKGKTVTRRIAYNMYNAFTEEEIDIFIVGDYPTKLMKFRITFPDDRRPEKVRAFIKPKDQPRVIADLVITDGSDHILWEIADFAPGTQYHLEWFW